MYSEPQQASRLCTVALVLWPQSSKFNGWNEKGLGLYFDSDRECVAQAAVSMLP